ncbi:undecaprenyl-diphosphate phosphatase [Fervidobacterium thailandense]|uniref:Undecaprenyl-diphosphatase n=1 Tax=Fervidobacterium thailandense TaxID=1008305 RepID=A0A1E3G131_9BACT|nr:undecaprenyl-diphosphate phosphatase [Fervidobacterium thailandense]ODN29932.1 UDP-diphosphatase [Fervidobacterium thailandense]
MKELVLGLVQGATEFLPISSSGHLALFSKLMSLPSDLSFFAFLHLATFVAVLILLWQDVASILVGLVRLDKNYWVLTLKLVVSSIPAGIVGLLFEEKVESAISSQKLIGVFFVVTAVALWLSDKFSGEKTMMTISYKDAFVIGLFQAIAILPGISRSGFTLIGALLVGMSRVEAFKYSFLMSLPVTLAAGLLKIPEVHMSGVVLGSFAGALFSGLVSLIVLRYLTVSAHLKYFSLYLIVPAVLSFLVK